MTAFFEKSLQIEFGLAGERLDKALAALCPDVSRSQIAIWIKQGEVAVDGSIQKPNFKVLGGERVEIRGTIEVKQDWDSAVDVPFEVLFEDSDILVINKPAGLIVHPGAGTSEPTLANGLLARSDRFRSLPRAGIVHRLDKDTSGVMVVAKSEASRLRLIEAFQEHGISRHYVGIVEGCMSGPRTVDLPLARSPVNRTRQAVVQGGREAKTHLIPIRVFRAHTLISARLETGRTHQIRVHASEIGFPLIGDRNYGAKQRLPANASAETIECLKGFPRQALHAKTLHLQHPINLHEMEFDAAIPEDLAVLLRVLEKDFEECKPTENAST